MSRTAGKEYVGALSAVEFIVSLTVLFAVTPFVTAFAWNTLVVGMFGAGTIGYGGAWVLMTIRALTVPKAPITNEEQTHDLIIRRIARVIAWPAMAALIVFIVGQSVGYL